ncbi:hypothetical protein H2202_000779 [Exophiala xenobiotica]|nr:hypothetical protein H2202_000779 [Exophiala xenobiotica]KAK5261813.1 hypothetical protein LTR40_001556 [Exophiala xenobiotica]KAK5351578.1 hypothetical protein LTR61_004928 [Exophiala xenobiotica]KAK5396416.1 hypothetical protein LTR79_006144 [Exophiala xenobiotica]KAK5417095.1 hypothetical protein LTR06_003082 [Exophiala xenobiotica]
MATTSSATEQAHGSLSNKNQEDTAKPSATPERHNQGLGKKIQQNETHDALTAAPYPVTPPRQTLSSSTTATPRLQSSSSESTMRNSQPPTPPPQGIFTETSYSVEEIPTDMNPTVSQMTLYGDSTPFYEVTVTAASTFARQLFETTPLNGPAGNENQTQTPPTKRWMYAGIVLALMNLVTIGIDTMIAVCMPDMLFDWDVLGFEWAFAGPAIGASATILFAGQLYAVFPFKTIYLLSAFLVLAGTSSAGLAQNMTFFFWTRILVGVGIGGQQLGTMLFLERKNTFMDKIRRDFFLTISTTLGMILGPIFGAIFAHRHVFFAWGFYTAFIIGTVLFFILAYLLPNKLDVVATGQWSYGNTFVWRNPLLRVDVLGSVLSFVGIMLLLVAFNFAGTLTLWSNKKLYITIVVGAALVFLLVLQQSLQVLSSPSTNVFPTQYLRRFKPTALFMTVFLTSGIVQTVLPYTAVYQLVTRSGPSALSTAFYLFFSMTAPFIIPILVIHVHLGGGMISKYAVWPSYALWTLISSVFILTGMVLLFINTPTLLISPSSSTGGSIPTVAREFALACIGFWASVILPIAHQIMDIYQPVAGQKHPYHNRVFVLFAFWLGAAVALTATGSIFMQELTRAMLPLVLSPECELLPPVGEEDARAMMLGYTYIRDATGTIFQPSIAVLENTFALAFAPELVFAVVLFLLAACMLGKKLRAGAGLGAVPREWVVAVAEDEGAGQDVELTEQGRGAVEA